MHHGVTFNFGSAKVSSPAIFETSFSYDNYIWIAATDYCTPDESQGYLGFSMATLPSQRFHFRCDNLKNILVRPFKFGMWV